MVQFVGLTNDIVSPRLGAFEGMFPADKKAIQAAWLGAGTNVGVFRIKNPKSYEMEVLRMFTLHLKGGAPDGHYLPLLNAPPFSGIYLRPGQTAIVEVPLLPHSGAWKTEFTFHRTSLPLFRFRSSRASGGWLVSSAWIEPTTELPNHGGPANGSQPIRSETNRTSAAAGSRR
jgi:hypothetical protein